MKKHKVIFCLCFLLTNYFVLLFFSLPNAFAQDDLYPIKVDVIEKREADYFTPENALAANFSALIQNNLEWYYDTLTEKTAADDKKRFAEAGIDPNKKLDLVEEGDQLFLLDRLKFKDGILLHTKVISMDGTIGTGPVVFVQENGLWKQTFKYSSDQDLFEYFDLAIPGEILNSEIQISPNQWNLQWYRQMLNKKSHSRSSEFKNVTVLCVLGNFKDSEGNDFSVEDIDPETLVLNYVVKPVSWDKGEKGETAVLINNDKQTTLEAQKLLKNWEKQNPLHQGFQKPIMLVKFSKFEAMKSLDDPDFGKTYTITVSGKFKDDETHFRGETQISIVPHGSMDRH